MWVINSWDRQNEHPVRSFGGIPMRPIVMVVVLLNTSDQVVNARTDIESVERLRKDDIATGFHKQKDPIPKM